jgi:hypothetical protein
VPQPTTVTQKETGNKTMPECKNKKGKCHKLVKEICSVISITGLNRPSTGKEDDNDDDDDDDDDDGMLILILFLDDGTLKVLNASTFDSWY